MIDVKLTADGELETSNGDFAFVSGDEAKAQQIMFMLKTTKGDCLVSPQIGCNLEQFIGAPNTPATHAEIEARITYELQENAVVGLPNVDCIRSAENEVLILIEFNSLEVNSKVMQVIGNLDLRTGQVFARSDSRII